MKHSNQDGNATSPEESFSSIFRRIFRSSGYTSQVAFAKAMGVTQSLISRYLGSKGERQPTREHIHKIAQLCAKSPETRKRYEQAMLQARARHEFPGLISSGDVLGLLPPERFSAEFRDHVRQDLTKWPLRRWRALVEAEGLTWRMVQRMLDGRGVLSLEQVRALARALSGNMEMYLFLVGAPSDRFYQVIAGQRQLLGDLLSLPQSSRQDLQLVLRQSSQQGPRRATTPRLSPRKGYASPSQSKRLHRGR
jgi:transcriptional regulator with XRE-family HTH domain